MWQFIFPVYCRFQVCDCFGFCYCCVSCVEQFANETDLKISTITQLQDTKFANETYLEIPDAVGDFLNKGPKHRLPNNIDKSFWEKVSLKH